MLLPSRGTSSLVDKRLHDDDPPLKELLEDGGADLVDKRLHDDDPPLKELLEDVSIY